MVHESQIPRSCDRCHAVKERCYWALHEVQCERCARLQLVCQINRPLRRPGRPRRLPSPSSQSRSHFDEITSNQGHSTLSSAPGGHRTATSQSDRWREVVIAAGVVLPSELQLLDQSLFQNEFMEQFILGPSFCEEHRKYLISHFLDSTVFLKDAYLACALSWDGDEPSLSSTPENEQPASKAYQYASSALSTLGSFEVKDMQDLSVCLVLGAVVHTFAIRLRASDVLTICRQTLNLIKAVYNSPSTRHISSDSIGFLTCLILTETAESLLSCSVPTIQFKLPLSEPAYVDRYVGICTTLLPLFYDLGKLSNDMLRERKERGVSHNLLLTTMAESLGALELTIRNWRPSVPDGFAERFTSTEVAHMLCQAQVMQTTALLIIHRLQYSFGSKEDKVLAMSFNILTQLELTFIATRKMVPCVDLPIVVSCMELQDEEERARWLCNISPISRYSEPFHNRICQILSAVWEARRHSAELHWYQLGDVIPHFS
ncbi:hypothetical protein PT974_00011 [Cladobotryum mycophilum]|uniref:Zn(2)-C6 fungal-type domain-containing protein n=1 Tax=Cladobotryum mycophilum TaxID=491253 RepID=A0ABR0T0Y3_9HYPO